MITYRMLLSVAGKLENHTLTAPNIEAAMACFVLVWIWSNRKRKESTNVTLLPDLE